MHPLEMAMRFSITQVLAMIDNEDIYENEDLPMMPGSDDEFNSEGVVMMSLNWMRVWRKT